jgi:hypothetical protein
MNTFAIPNDKQFDLEIISNMVKNPLTGRMINTTGKTFKQLLNKNILQLPQSDTSKVIFVGENPDNAMKIKNSLDVCEDKNHLLKTRGNKVCKARRVVSRDELQKKVQQVSIEVYKENKHLFNDNMDSQQISTILETLIKQRMVDSTKPSAPKTKLNKAFHYIVENIESDDNYDESEYYDTEEEDEDEDDDDL